MKYLCLIYDNEAQQAKMTKEEGGKMMGEYRDFTQDITKSGHYLGGNPLQPVGTATTVRVRDGEIEMTDGPFAVTKEVLVGFYLLDCDGLDEALRHAARFPTAGFGSVEVRPLVGPDYNPAADEP